MEARRDGIPKIFFVNDRTIWRPASPGPPRLGPYRNRQRGYRRGFDVHPEGGRLARGLARVAGDWTFTRLGAAVSAAIAPAGAVLPRYREGLGKRARSSVHGRICPPCSTAAGAQSRIARRRR